MLSLKPSSTMTTALIVVTVMIMIAQVKTKEVVRTDVPQHMAQMYTAVLQLVHQSSLWQIKLNLQFLNHKPHLPSSSRCMAYLRWQSLILCCAAGAWHSWKACAKAPDSRA